MSNEPLISREDILHHLRTSVCKIVFDKSDGTERTLYATLQQGYLPIQTVEEAQKASEKPRKPRPESSIVAWDVEANDWRSFNIGSVKAFSNHAKSVTA